MLGGEEIEVYMGEGYCIVGGRGDRSIQGRRILYSGGGGGGGGGEEIEVYRGEAYYSRGRKYTSQVIIFMSQLLHPTQHNWCWSFAPLN